VNDWPSHLPIYLGFRDEIVTAIDIGRRLGVSNQRVHQTSRPGPVPTVDSDVRTLARLAARRRRRLDRPALRRRHSRSSTPATRLIGRLDLQEAFELLDDARLEIARDRTHLVDVNDVDHPKALRAERVDHLADPDPGRVGGVAEAIAVDVEERVPEQGVRRTRRGRTSARLGERRRRKRD
jgi:hypothetical protein